MGSNLEWGFGWWGKQMSSGWECDVSGKGRVFFLDKNFSMTSLRVRMLFLVNFCHCEDCLVVFIDAGVLQRV